MIKIKGIENALIDLTVDVSSDFVEMKLGLEKSGMFLVDDSKAKEILNLINDLEMVISPGGSVSNIMTAIGQYGIPCKFVGSVGDDFHGARFKAGMRDGNVEPILNTNSEKHTGFAITFITEDGERTFAVNLGCATNILKESLLDNETEYNVLSGFQVEDTKLRQVFIECLAGSKIVLDVSDVGVIKRMGNTLLNFINEYVKICFLNDAEFDAILDKSALNSCELVVLKHGAKGCTIYDNINDNEIEVPGIKVEVINTNGAGDAFAGAFLAGLLKGKSLEECGVLANDAGAKVVSQKEARLQLD